jgi:PAS domain S-box-containing protein
MRRTKLLRLWRSPDTYLVTGLLLACLMAVVFLPAFFSSGARDAQDALYLRANPLQQDGGTLDAIIDGMSTGERAYLATGDATFLEPYEANHGRLAATLHDTEPRLALSPPDVRNAVNAALTAAQTWQGVADTAIAERQAGSGPVDAGATELAAYRAAAAPLPALLAKNRLDALAHIDNIENNRVAAIAASGLAVALLAAAYFRLLYQRGRLRAAGQRSATYIRHLMESLRDPVLVIDAQGGALRDVNRAAEQISGYNRDELLALSVADLRAPGDGDGRSLTAALAGAAEPVRVALRRKDGEIMPVEFVGAPATFDGERVLVASGRDIRRRLEDEAEREALLRQTEAARAAAEAVGEELRQSRDHLAAVFASIHDGIIVLDRHGRVLTANAAAARVFGYAAPDDAAGRLLFDADGGLEVFDEAAEPLAASAFPSARVLRGEPEAEGLVRLLLAGEERWLIVRAAPLYGEDGRLENAIVSLHDITERRQAEDLRRVAENLSRSNTALQEFAYVASHDLQEPLRMIASYTQLLQRRYAGRLDSDADEFIGYAVDGATRMKQLIHDLLQYSRVETHAGSLQPVDCAAVLRQVRADLRVAIDEARAQVEIGPLPVLLGDPTQLRQVFQNLIGNAIKFRGDAPPLVRVCAERHGAEYLFTVADNGIGFDAQYTERIFIVFQRLHTREAYPGTGIGLALCKKIVERHGGRIWVESEQGQGARFYFALPALSEEPNAEAHAIPA